MVSASSCLEVNVTLRKRSDCVPTNPTIHVSGPLARTVSTLIGSLKSVPVKIWPGLMIFGVILRYHPNDFWNMVLNFSLIFKASLCPPAYFTFAIRYLFNSLAISITGCPYRRPCELDCSSLIISQII
jgi:hypothetical protein